MDTNLSNTLLLLATGAAIVAALAAWWSARLAYRADSRAVSSEKINDACLQTYLIDSFRYFDPHAASYLYAFSISVTNISERGNAIARVELELHCHLRDSAKIVHVLQHNADRATRLPQEGLLLLSTPRSLAGFETVSGWVFYEVRSAFLKTHFIDHFRINVPNTRGAPSFVDSYIVKELHRA